MLLPVYNDWDAARVLLAHISDALSTVGLQARVIMIDDGSTDLAPGDLESAVHRGLCNVTTVRLRRNLGHQRAIAIGLALINERMPDAVVVVMDSDGEDRPSDIPRLLAKFHQGGDREIVFAQRIRRTEGPLFRIFYWLYRALHFALTGIRVQVGNFSVIPPDSLRCLVVTSDLWNHYAATVFQSKLPYTMVPTDRGTRLMGQSHMNYVSLVTHGLSAISVFADRVGVRVLIAAVAVLSLSVTCVAAAVGLWLTGAAVFPLWASIAAGLALFFLLQLCLAAGMFVLLVLFGRAGTSFIPARDFHHFIIGHDHWSASGSSRL